MHNILTQPIIQLITTLCHAMDNTTPSLLTPRLMIQLAHEIQHLATSDMIPSAQRLNESLPNETKQLTDQLATQLHQLRNQALQRSPLEQLVLLALLSTALLNATRRVLTPSLVPEKSP
jgi:hypothetical protein